MDKKGFTIIEVMLATVLFSIIALSVIYFISTGTKTSNTAQYEINLQTEAQEVTNQLTTFTMEGNHTQAFNYGDNVVYIIYHNNKETLKTDLETVVLFHKNDKRLYYYEFDDTADLSKIKTELTDPSVTITIGELMGEHIGDFAVTCNDNTSIVQFHLEIQIGSKKFSTDSSVEYRNKKVIATTPLIEMP